VLCVPALLVLAGATQASVQMLGVLATGSHSAGIDSADVRIDTLSLLVHTQGWSGGPQMQDTFRFQPLTRWPTAVKLFYRTESTLVLAVSPVSKDSWYVLAGFVPTEPKVLFHEVTGVEESAVAGSPRPRLSVSPSVAGGPVFVRAALEPAEPFRAEFYDAAGSLVRTFKGRAARTGEVLLKWAWKDASDRLLPEGVYYCSLVAGQSQAVRKLVLAR
jgi:hypothetical protein